MGAFIDLIGKRFGRLTVLSRAENSKSGRLRWNCVCDCGTEITVAGFNLRSGNTHSCGCFCKDRIREVNSTHGMSETLAYGSWLSMKARCKNHRHQHYKHYGGRGITVCERWILFENFYADMGERPEGMSIERRDNNGNYCPENCCWETKKNQARNTSLNRIIKYDGKSQCISAWAEEIGINYGTLLSRLKKHQPKIAFNM